MVIEDVALGWNQAVLESDVTVKCGQELSHSRAELEPQLPSPACSPESGSICIAGTGGRGSS